MQIAECTCIGRRCCRPYHTRRYSLESFIAACWYRRASVPLLATDNYVVVVSAKMTSTVTNFTRFSVLLAIFQLQAATFSRYTVIQHYRHTAADDDDALTQN